MKKAWRLGITSTFVIADGVRSLHVFEAYPTLRASCAVADLMEDGTPVIAQATDAEKQALEADPNITITWGEAIQE